MPPPPILSQGPQADASRPPLARAGSWSSPSCSLPTRTSSEGGEAPPDRPSFRSNVSSVASRCCDGLVPGAAGPAVSSMSAPASACICITMPAMRLSASSSAGPRASPPMCPAASVPIPSDSSAAPTVTSSGGGGVGSEGGSGGGGGVRRASARWRPNPVKASQIQTSPAKRSQYPFAQRACACVYMRMHACACVCMRVHAYACVCMRMRTEGENVAWAEERLDYRHVHLHRHDLLGGLGSALGLGLASGFGLGSALGLGRAPLHSNDLVGRGGAVALEGRGGS